MKWKNFVISGPCDTAALHHRLLVSAITAVVILGGILAGSSISALGSVAADGSSAAKYYTSIEILPGDTLWGIANRYRTSGYDDTRDYIEEIKELNGLKEDVIHAGQYLAVPYYPDSME